MQATGARDVTTVITTTERRLMLLLMLVLMRRMRITGVSVSGADVTTTLTVTPSATATGRQLPTSVLFTTFLHVFTIDVLKNLSSAACFISCFFENKNTV